MSNKLHSLRNRKNMPDTVRCALGTWLPLREAYRAAGLNVSDQTQVRTFLNWMTDCGGTSADVAWLVETKLITADMVADWESSREEVTA